MQPTASLSRREGAAWLAVLPLLLYLLLGGAGAWAGVYVTQFRALSLAILIGVFVVWAVAAWRYPSARPRSRLAPVIGLIVAAQLIAAVLSPLQRIGLEYAAYTAVLGGLYLLLVRLMARPALARRIALVLAIATILIAAVYLAVSVGIWMEWWRILGRLTIPPLRPDYIGLMYGAPGILTAFLVCATFASISILWPSGSFRVLCVVLAVVVLIAVVVAAARSGWVALAVAAVVGGAAILLSGRRLTIPRSRRTLAAASLAGLAAVVLLVAIGPSVMRRFTEGGGEDLRVSLAANATRLFQAHPLTGAGPGTWVINRTSLTPSDELDWYIPHAHNAPMQTLAESGLLGAAVAVIAFLAVGHLVLRAFRSGDPVRRSLAVGVVVIGTYLGVHQLFDFFLDMPAILFAAVLPLVALDAVETRVDEARHAAAPGRPLVVVPAALAVVPLVLLLAVERPAFAGELASEAVAADPARAVSLATEAADADSAPTSYRWTRGLAEAAVGDKAAAAADLRWVAERDDLPQAWLNVARLRADLGDGAGAHEALDRALRLGRQQPAIDIAAIPLLLELDDRERAQEQALSALSGAPTLADDPWWESSSDLIALRDTAIDRLAASSDHTVAWQVAMLSGDAERAKTIAKSLPDAERAITESVIDAWSGVPGARAALEKAVRTQPLGSGAGWAARVAARDGDQAAAARFRRLASIAYGSTLSDSGYDVVVTTREPQLQPPGPDAGFHFRYAYHRSTPFDMLIPGLPEIDLR